MNETKYLVYLHSIGFTQRKLRAIFYKEQNYKEVYNSVCLGMLQKRKFTEKQTNSILKKYQQISQEAIDQKILEKGIQVVTIFDNTYPRLLKEISNPPFMFYLQGTITDTPCLSIIGSRNISIYGKRITQKMASELSKTFTIVSGGAYGCDSEAHNACLGVDGVTYVIVGTGIDVIYPISNSKLYHDIVASGGAIISIFPLGESGSPHNFPVRNEIISGLTLGTLVIEAGEKSGTLITAKLALEQGRDVFAIPGEIDKQNSIGCNLLIKRGEAKFTTHPKDIIEEYSFLKYSPSKEKPGLEGDQKHICDLLSVESLTIDSMSHKIGKDTRYTTTQISLLEMKKVLYKNREGKYELL